MKFIETEIAGVFIIEPVVHRDRRGFFLEFFHGSKYREGGITASFVQDNHSLSHRRTLRGLHAQRRRPQGKLIRVVEGEIHDIAVDLRRSSSTFGRWVSVVLSAENFRLMYIPPGFLHGFCVTSERAQVEYKCTEYYDPTDEFGVIWNDPDLAVDWPIDDAVVSEKDSGLPRLAEIADDLPDYPV